MTYVFRLLPALLVVATAAHAAPFQLLATKSETALGRWGAQWWLWALSAPVSPIEDLTGKQCAVNQAGPVWFLAGTYQNGGAVTRKCTVPAGKAVLFPLVNSYALGGTQAECNTNFTDLKGNFDRARIDALKIDAQNVTAKRLRGRVACFYLPDQEKWLGVDGYWVMVRLAKGQHTLSYRAHIPGFAQNVSYKLTQR